MDLVDSEIGRKIVERITLKNVKTNIGHDLCGMYCDFYLDGQKMGYLNDDGWGGEIDIVYDNDNCQKLFEYFLKENNVAQLLFEGKWSFMGSADKISFDSQVDSLITERVNLSEREKSEKKAQKECLKGIVIGNSQKYQIFGFRMPLKEIVEKYGAEGVLAIQKSYMRAKKAMTDGDRILNTNLEELGIKL